MPLQRDIHTDKKLSNISVKYMNEEYVGTGVFPVVPVQKDTDLYRVFTRNFRIPETKRANRAEAREHNFDITTNTYALAKHALVSYVSDDDARNYDIASLKADTTEELTDKIQARLELDVASLFTTTNWSLNVSLAATAQWTSNSAGSNPIPLMDTAATTIIANSGQRPTFAVIPRSEFIAAKNHVSILDRTKYTSAEMTKTMMAALFDLGEILVPTAVQDTSAKGLTDVIANIWGDNVFVGYKPPRPSPLRPSCGYTFKLNKPMVKTWREEKRESIAVEVGDQRVPKVVASLTGYLIRDVSG